QLFRRRSVVGVSLGSEITPVSFRLLPELSQFLCFILRGLRQSPHLVVNLGDLVLEGVTCPRRLFDISGGCRGALLELSDLLVDGVKLLMAFAEIGYPGFKP